MWNKFFSFELIRGVFEGEVFEEVEDSEELLGFEKLMNLEDFFLVDLFIISLIEELSKSTSTSTSTSMSMLSMLSISILSILSILSMLSILSRLSMLSILELKIELDK